MSVKQIWVTDELHKRLKIAAALQDRKHFPALFTLGKDDAAPLNAVDVLGRYGAGNPFCSFEQPFHNDHVLPVQARRDLRAEKEHGKGVVDPYNNDEEGLEGAECHAISGIIGEKEGKGRPHGEPEERGKQGAEQEMEAPHAGGKHIVENKDDNGKKEERDDARQVIGKEPQK